MLLSYLEHPVFSQYPQARVGCITRRMAGPIRFLHPEPSQHYDSSTFTTKISKNPNSNHTLKTKIPPLKDGCSQLLIAAEPSKVFHKTSGAKADPDIEDAIEQSTSEDPKLAQSDGPNRRPSITDSPPSSSDIYRIQWPVEGSKRQKKIYPLASLGSDGWSEAQYQERAALVIGHLKKAVDDHPELRDYARHIDYASFMCGPTPSTAVSSIVVYCPQTLVPRLRVCFNKKAMERLYCGRRSRFHSLFKKIYPARPPFRLVYFRTPGTPTKRKAAETDICGHIKSDTTMCGTLVKHGGHTATLALTLSVDSQYLGLTVNHLFSKSCDLEDLKYSRSSVLSHSESVSDDCEEWTINDDDLVSVDQLWVDDMDYDDSGECKWPSLDNAEMAHESGSDHRHAATNDLLPWVSVGCKVDLLEEPAPPEPDLDWSLVKLPVQYASRPNAFYPNGEGYPPRYLTTCANTPRYHGVPVYMISGASGLRSGLLLGNYSYIGAKAGQGHCKVWTVILDDPTGVIEGDCGSVIVDQQTSEVYGHVVGANPLDQAYVVPISATTEQIRKSLQATEVTIPQPPHPLHESHFQKPHTTTFNGEEPEELRDFRKWVDEASVPGICGMGATDTPSFMPVSVLNTYLDCNLPSILKGLFGVSENKERYGQIRKRYVKVFATLLYIGKGELIDQFQEYDNLRDKKLPFAKKPDEFPSSPDDEDFFHKFYNRQWMFCAPEFHNGQIDSHYEDERILPIIRKEELGSPGNTKARAYKIVFHGSYNKLDPDVENPSDNTFVLKTYTCKNSEQDYRDKLQAFLKLRASSNPSTCVIGFYGSYWQHDTYNIILEYANSGTLEEYFQNVVPPSKSEDIVQFWEDMFNIADALRNIHSMHPGDGEAPELFQG